jgi:hypothetical protein
MKKIIVTLAIAVSTLSAFAGNQEVNPSVLTAFNNEFKTAQQVEWAAGTNYYRATFTYNEKHVFAYYSFTGELLGLSRYVKLADLPLVLQGEMKNNYADYWISDLFEVANADGTSYYATIEKADTKIVLKSSDAKSWTNFQKTKKS